MSASRIFLCLVAILLVLASFGAFWIAGWMEKRPLECSGGLYIPGRMEIAGPHFLQGDSRWAHEKLGGTRDSLASVGCAVTSAAMVLAGYGVDTDPKRLNVFLKTIEDGYTREGWIYWEKAAEVDAALAAQILPHYEDKASHFLIDWNLLQGNPVIVRIRYPSGITHFVVICGKEGFDYLIRDPGSDGKRGVYPLKEFAGPIEALRFYKKPKSFGQSSERLGS